MSDAPYAVDEQMRVEALRAAVALLAANPPPAGLSLQGVNIPELALSIASRFEEWLLNEEPVVGTANLNAALEGAD